MKALLLALLSLSLCRAGETSLTTVYQPLNGFGAEGPFVLPVVCKDHDSHSGMSRGGLITKPNLAPTNDPGGASDINLASVAGIVMGHDIPEPGKQVLSIDCSKAVEKPDGFELPTVFRAALECLRLTFPEEIEKAELRFTIPEGMGGCRKIADEFLKHDKRKPFYKAE